MKATKNQEAIEYEKIAKRIYEMLSPSSRVQHDARLPGKESGADRQVDVLIEETVAGHKIRVVVDCKNWNSRISVPDVGSFASLVRDVGAHKGVMLSKKGYSKPSLPYARQLGIDLCQLHDAGSRNWKLDLKVPIVVEELGVTVETTFRAAIDRPTTLSEILEANISGSSIKGLFQERLAEGKLDLSVGEHEFDHGLRPAILQIAPDWTIDLDNLRIRYKIFSSCLRLGYVDQLPSSKALVNLSDNVVNMFCDIRDIVSYRETFLSIRSITDPAVRIEGYFKCTLTPKFEDLKSTTIKARRIG